MTTKEKVRSSQKKYRLKNIEAIRVWSAAHYQKNKKKYSAIRRELLINNKTAAFMAYGGLVCVCSHNGTLCGDKPLEFLAIDHIGGRKLHSHDASMHGRKLYMWLKRNNYPVGFRVLCHNCNQSLGIFNRCPLATKTD